MNRRTSLLIALLLTAAACGSPLDNTAHKLIEQVRLGDPSAQQTYAENKDLLEAADAAPVWIRTLQEDESPQVREWSAQMLGNIGDPQAIPALVAAMSGPRNVRDAAAAAIKQFDDDQAAEAFILALREGNRDARALALGQISRTGGNTAVSAVAAIAGGDDDLLATSALNTLGDIATDDAAAALAQIAGDASADEGRRSTAIANLGRIQSDTVGAVIDGVVATLAEQDGAAELLAQARALKR